MNTVAAPLDGIKISFGSAYLGLIIDPDKHPVLAIRSNAVDACILVDGLSGSVYCSYHVY
jgi:hypothetical protein